MSQNQSHFRVHVKNAAFLMVDARSGVALVFCLGGGGCGLFCCSGVVVIVVDLVGAIVDVVVCVYLSVFVSLSACLCL